jgi:hypothetical protein
MQKFIEVLTEQYKDLFANNPEYAHSANKYTPEKLAQKMTQYLKDGCSANKDGEGIKRTCKILGIKHTYKAIRGYLTGELTYVSNH